jgi:hypothetical protein
MKLVIVSDEKTIYPSRPMNREFISAGRYSLNSFERMTFTSFSRIIMYIIINKLFQRLRSSTQYAVNKFIRSIANIILIIIRKLIFGVYRSVCVFTILARTTFSHMNARKNTKLARIPILKIIRVNQIGMRIPIGESPTRCFTITRSVKRKGIKTI